MIGRAVGLGLVGLLALAPVLAEAHGASTHTSNLWLQWNFHWNVVAPIALATSVYALGVTRLWHRAGVGRSISVARVVAYALGVLALIVALISPLEALAGSLFSLHMVQHLLIILVAPPLLIAGNPDVALLWALPQQWRARWGRIEQRMGNSITGGKGPLIVVLLATGVLWMWHMPNLYDLAVQNDLVHWAEHAGFLVTSVLFWITVLRLRVRDHVGNGMRILYVFGMAVQGSLLGALITFASRPLYQSYIGSTIAGWDLGPLEDQQLAGIIMWVPPALLYIGVVAYLFVNWLSAIERRNQAGISPKSKGIENSTVAPSGGSRPTQI
jgi:putative membrane protein